MSLHTEHPAPRKTGFKAKHESSLTRLGLLVREYGKLESVADARALLIDDTAEHIKLVQAALVQCSDGLLGAPDVLGDPTTVSGREQQAIFRVVLLQAVAMLRYFHERALAHRDLCDEISEIHVPDNSALVDRETGILPRDTSLNLSNYGEQLGVVMQAFGEASGPEDNFERPRH